MAKFFRAAAICISLSVIGCDIHPLPQDVTHLQTDYIARKIRCEARAALKDNLTQWLTSPKVQELYPRAYKLGIEFEDGTRPLNTFRASLFQDKDVRSIIEKFQNSAIGYDFSFDMTETNNLDATLDLIKPTHHATGSAAIGGGVDRTRENIRSFTITDTFINLLTKVKDNYCNPFIDEKNYMYPITGTIGIGEMINTFVNLALFENLAGKGPPTMGDTITFTTKLSGSATPKIVLTPIGHALQVADASIVVAATRNDVHKVIVALALPAPKKATGAKAGVGLLVNTKADVTSAELIAAHTIEQIITRFELGKSGAIIIP